MGSSVHDSESHLLINQQIVTVTNSDKYFWPKDKITKGDLINYYRKISPWILPYLKGRPESLKRFPNGIEGENFFHKDIEDAPSWTKLIRIKARSTGKITHYLLCENEETLVYMINLGCVDINTWSSRSGHLDKPDYMILDLDPEEIGFKEVVKTARVVHDILEAAQIPNYVKTSGASGLHIYVPMGAKYTYKQVRHLAAIIVAKVHEKLPTITSLERSPSNRKGKVYLDIYQNGRAQTVASPYSVRPRPGAPVSTPLEWAEVNDKLNPNQFTIRNIGKRLEDKGDIFKPVLGKGIDMGRALKKLQALK